MIMNMKHQPARIAVATALLLLVSLPAAVAQTTRDRRRTPIVEVFERSRDAVVNISTTRIQETRSPFEDIFGRMPRSRRAVHSVGSGFVVHESGYIVTNSHVIARASDIGVSFADGKTFPAQPVGIDNQHDLAILKVDTGRPLKALPLGQSDDILIGETVVAIGNPLGLQHTVTSGIVSALDRQLEFGSDTEYDGLIQTDAAINPGNSGGPLLNINGELIGINTAIRGDAQNVGFAIPVGRLWELLPAILDIERRERVRFGLHVSRAPAQVVYVEPGSPAARAGIRSGDELVAFNGRPIRDGFDYYAELLRQRPGSDVLLNYRRGRLDTARQVTVPLETIPAPDGNALAKRLLGVEVEPFPEDIRRRYQLPRDIGLLVRRVNRRSAADRAEIIANDLIRSVDRYPVSSIDQLGLILERVKPGEQVYVEGLRLNADPPFRWRVMLRADG